MDNVSAEFEWSEREKSWRLRPKVVRAADIHDADLDMLAKAVIPFLNSGNIPPQKPGVSLWATAKEPCGDIRIVLHLTGDNVRYTNVGGKHSDKQIERRLDLDLERLSPEAREAYLESRLAKTRSAANEEHLRKLRSFGERYLTVSEFARATGKDARGIRALCLEGKLPAILKGKTWLIPEAVLNGLEQKSPSANEKFEKQFLTVSEFAAAVKREASGIRASCSQGRIPAVKKGKTWLIPWSAQKLFEQTSE